MNRQASSAKPTSYRDAQNPTDISWSALAPALSLSTVALVLVATRWYTRYCIVGRVGADDILLSVSMFLSLGMTVAIAIQFFEKSQTVIRETQQGSFTVSIAPTVAKLVIVNNVLYSAVTNLTKSSIVIQYLRLFQGVWMRRACYSTLFLLLAAASYGVFAGIFMCVPVHKFWTPQAEGHCENAAVLWLAAAGMNIVMDWIVWILPMPVISQLKLPTRQRAGVMAVFALGGFICATSVARLALVHAADKSEEHTKSGVRAVTWSAIEANVGIVCASLMAVKPLLLRFFPKLLEDKETPRHHEHLPTISDIDQSSWTGGSVSTTCAANCSAETLSWPSTPTAIKVTTQLGKRESITPAKPTTRHSQLLNFRDGN